MDIFDVEYCGKWKSSCADTTPYIVTFFVVTLFSDADFIPCIRISGDDGTMDIKLDTAVTTAHDVTGGIRLKLDCAVEIVLKHRGTIPVIICSCTDGAYENICLSGKLNGKLGTIVEYIDENI